MSNTPKGQRRKPDLRLAAKERHGDNVGKIGAAWINRDDQGNITHINLQLSPCVVLNERDDLVLTLFPADGE